MSPKKKKQFKRNGQKPCSGGWKHIASGMDGSGNHPVMLFGLNTFDYPWESTGQRAEVTDPLHNETHSFPVCRLEVNGKKHEFAFGEYCMNICGVYLRG